jgi:DNA-binding beta-propeller fold protein YncE
MTASPHVAPLPGAAPVPDTADLPSGTGSDDGSLTDEPPQGRRRKAFVLIFLVGLLVFLLSLAVWYLLFRQPIPIPTIPGEVIMPTYTTAAYGVDRPMGVAASADGSRIYVGETGGEQIARILDSSGNEVGQLLPPVSTGTDHVPLYIAVHPVSGEVWITDRATAAVYVYDAAGTYQRTFEPGEEIGAWQPLALNFDGTGNLYVTDVSLSPHRVHVFDASGVLSRTIGGDLGMAFPNGVAADSAGNVYVTDGNNGRLLVMGPDGSRVAQIGRGVGSGNLGLPRGVVIDGQDRVYVADATGQGVFVYGAHKPGEARLDYLGFFGGEGAQNGAFMFPVGVSVDARGRIYVADSGNDRVQLWSY